MNELTIQKELILDDKTVRDMLVQGNGKVTDQEVNIFIELCRYQKLNPFIGDVFLIKYGNMPAKNIISYHKLLKRANKNKEFNGHKAGIIVYDKEKKEQIEIEGTVYLNKEQVLLGGWCTVYYKTIENPFKQTVLYSEYEQKTKDGKTNSVWTEKPATMIRKVAVAQAIKEGFPEEFGNLYIEEEIQQENIEPSITEINVDVDNKKTTDTGTTPEKREFEI